MLRKYHSVADLYYFSASLQFSNFLLVTTPSLLLPSYQATQDEVERIKLHFWILKYLIYTIKMKLCGICGEQNDDAETRIILIYMNRL